MKDITDYTKEELEETRTLLSDISDVIEDWMSGEEDFSVCCKNHGLDERSVQMLLNVVDGFHHFDRTISNNKIRSFYRNMGIIGGGNDRFPDDAYETALYVFCHPTEFGLSEAEGKILYMHYIEGKTYRETALTLGIKERQARAVNRKAANRFSPRHYGVFLGIGMNKYREAEREIAERMENDKQWFIRLNV